MMKETRKKQLNYRIAACVFGVAVVCCISYFSIRSYRLRQNEQIYEKLRETEATEVQLEIGAETGTETEDLAAYCEPLYDFEELRIQNEDIYAWITVPETQIDYPILQSETDNYYLDYNIDGSKGYPGSIYTNQCNQKDFTDWNSVLYGHNMKNGTMFGSLHKFEDEEFFDNNDKIYVYTEDMRLTYQIYAAVKFSDVYIPSYYDVTVQEETEKFLAAVEEYREDAVSHIRDDMDILPEDRFITLSTCVNGERNKRYIIVGKLVEEAFYEESKE